MDTFVLHYKKLKDRLSVLNDQLKREGLHEYNVIDGEPYESFFLKYAKNKNKWSDRINGLGYDPIFRLLTDAEISILYKHFFVINSIAERNGADISLILEDDAIICEGFKEKITNNLEETPCWDLIFLGNGCGMHAKNIEEGKIAYRKEHPATRCLDSYLIQPCAAKKIAEKMVDFVLPIDFELNYLIKELDLKVYWWEPTLVTQGSQNGKWKSSIQNL